MCISLGEVVGALCGVGGGNDVCGEMMSYIIGGIQGNLERDNGEIDPHLTQRLSSSSSDDGFSKQTEQRVS